GLDEATDRIAHHLMLLTPLDHLLVLLRKNRGQTPISGNRCLTPIFRFAITRPKTAAAGETTRGRYRVEANPSAVKIACLGIDSSDIRKPVARETSEPQDSNVNPDKGGRPHALLHDQPDRCGPVRAHSRGMR